MNQHDFSILYQVHSHENVRAFMSDHLTASHSRRKKIHVPGTSRNKKYLKVLVLVLFAALAGLAYVAVNSGILADENPTIPQHLITRINSERLSHNLPPVQTDDVSLANQAERMSQETRVSPMAYNSPAGQKSGGITDVFIYPKISWAVSSINLEPPLFDSWIAEDKNFERNLLNKGYKNVGIGISSDSYNYYIVTKWQ
jgi:hypothetical protein